MLDTSRYPADQRHALISFSRAIFAWARAAGLPVDDVVQSVVLASIEGLNPASAVPRWLKIRKILIAGKPCWRSDDPGVLAAQNDCIFSVDLHDIESSEQQKEQQEIGIGGTEEIAARHKITRRAAQMRVVTQHRRFVENGDLFEGQAA